MNVCNARLARHPKNAAISIAWPPAGAKLVVMSDSPGGRMAAHAHTAQPSRIEEQRPLGHVGPGKALEFWPPVVGGRETPGSTCRRRIHRMRVRSWRKCDLN